MDNQKKPSLTGDGAPQELRTAADWEEQEAADRAAALRSEARTAYRAGVPDKHSPEL